MVGAVGFELTTLWSQTRCATRLRYAPTNKYCNSSRSQVRALESKKPDLATNNDRIKSILGCGIPKFTSFSIIAIAWSQFSSKMLDLGADLYNFLNLYS